MKREEEFGEDYILKRMPSDKRQYGNSDTTRSNDENWKRRNRETDEKENGNLTVGVRDTSEISGNETLQGR